MLLEQLRLRYLSQYVRSMVCQAAKKQNLQTTKDFTPGSIEWDRSQQKNIFKIIPAYKIGVRLTNFYMMILKKSLSWAIGVGKSIHHLKRMILVRSAKQ